MSSAAQCLLFLSLARSPLASPGSSSVPRDTLMIMTCLRPTLQIKQVSPDPLAGEIALPLKALPSQGDLRLHVYPETYS